MFARRRRGWLWLGLLLTLAFLAGCTARANPAGGRAFPEKPPGIPPSAGPTASKPGSAAAQPGPGSVATTADGDDLRGSAGAEELGGGVSRAATGAPGQPEPDRGLRVPVLMYHEVGDGPNELYVSEKNFADQLNLLAENGYHTITLDQLYAAMTRTASLPPKPVVLTFDDGYASHYSRAFPLLKQYGFTGVFFVYTRGVGGANRVTWEQLREMQAAGMEIESHTVSHVDLAAISVSPDRLRREIEGSRTTLQAELGVPVEYFCYPAGRYNDQVLKAVKKAGYKAALTTKPGWVTSHQSPLEWRRVRINRSDTLRSFAAKVGTPWPGLPPVRGGAS